MDEATEDAIDVVTGQVLALMITGTILGRWAADRDPGFPEKASAAFDAVAGRLRAVAQEKQTTDRHLVYAREAFRSMVSNIKVTNLPTPETSPLQKKSLRRRFLDWLEAG